MPLTSPIPDEALPTVEILRERVRRPRGLPRSIHPRRRSPQDFLRWTREGEAACPAGLLKEDRSDGNPHMYDPEDISSMPWLEDELRLHFGVDYHEAHEVVQAKSELARESFDAFLAWWDAQTDPAAAVEAVWSE